MKPKKQDFMKALLIRKTDVRVVGGSGFKELQNGNLAKINIGTGKNVVDYTNLTIRIINKVNGPIDSQVFNFDGFLKFKSSVNANHDKEEFKVIEYCGWDWHINTPTTESIDDLLDAVMEYIAFFD
jgi:hypothetical protein